MFFAWTLNVLGLLLGAGLGARALFDPRWAAKFVRLKEDGEGGFAEFRATYGGVFAGVHGCALVLSARYLLGGDYVVGVAAIGAAAVISAAWAGACAGRLLSMWRDGTRTRFNLYSAGVEAAVCVCVAAPWVAWFFSTAD